MAFSKDFLWGAASAAYQVEGAYDEDGKVPGIWDALSEGHVKHGDNGNVACDHYHRMKEDVAIMKQLGFKSYRFSVAWTRIIKNEAGEVNECGLKFYRDLVNELTAAGIEPLCTLYHWNLPMWAYEKGGWKNAQCADWFAYYVGVVVNALSDKVRYWFTVNEPQCVTGLGYALGEHAPFERNDMPALRKILKNLILAHGKAVIEIRAHAKQKPLVGFASTNSVYLPKNESKEAIEQAKQTFFATSEAAWGEAMILGNISEKYFGKVNEKEREIICQKLDFYAFNNYTAGNYNDGFAVRYGIYAGMPRSSIDLALAPSALYWAPKFLYERYGLPVMVSENGFASCDWKMLDGAVHDPQRIDYITRYLKELKRVTDEVPVLGYQYWSFTDNFEWAIGYDARYGLVYIDYLTQERTIKDSAKYYSEIIKTNGGNL